MTTRRSRTTSVVSRPGIRGARSWLTSGITSSTSLEIETWTYLGEATARIYKTGATFRVALPGRGAVELHPDTRVAADDLDFYAVAED